MSPNILGLYGLWGVQTIAFFPYAYQLIADILAQSDPRLEQAARNLGAGPFSVFRTVTLPLARPGLVSAVLLVAIYVVEDFGNPALIAGQYTVLPTLAYGLISGFGDFAGAAVVSTILLGIALVLYLFRLRLEGRRSGSFVTVTGRAASMPRPPVPTPVTVACFIGCLLLTGLIMLVYGVLVLSAFVEAYPFNFTPTLKHFEYVGAHFTSLRNSLVYSGTAAIVCSAVRHPAGVHRPAQGVARARRGRLHRHRAGGGAGHLLWHRLRHGVQSALAGLDGPRHADTLSMVFWNIPVGYRAAVAGLQQIDRSIDEAATSLGAGSLRAFKDVLLPLLRGPYTTGLVTAFVRAITTLSVVIFLFTPSTVVATITIFQLVNDFNWGGATAFTVSVIAMSIAVLLLVWAVTGRRVRLDDIPNA